MFQRRLLASILSLVFLATALPTDANSGHTEQQTAEGIAILMVLSAIEKAAAASANADRSDDNYSYHHGLGARENAIAACVHRAYKALQKAGGLYMRFDKVKRIEHRGNGDFEVTIDVTEVYPKKHSIKSATCVVNHNHIKRYFSS